MHAHHLETTLDVPIHLHVIEGIFACNEIGREDIPTHISVLARLQVHLLQIYEAFLDHVDWNTQVRLINQFVEHFDIRRAYYEATRGRTGRPRAEQSRPWVKFTSQKKVALAQGLERYVRGNPDL